MSREDDYRYDTSGRSGTSSGWGTHGSWRSTRIARWSQPRPLCPHPRRCHPLLRRSDSASERLPRRRLQQRLLCKKSERRRALTHDSDWGRFARPGSNKRGPDPVHTAAHGSADASHKRPRGGVLQVKVLAGKERFVPRRRPRCDVSRPSSLPKQGTRHRELPLLGGASRPGPSIEQYMQLTANEEGQCTARLE